jgi:hypothetical protein
LQLIRITRLYQAQRSPRMLHLVRPSLGEGGGADESCARPVPPVAAASRTHRAAPDCRVRTLYVAVPFRATPHPSVTA